MWYLGLKCLSFLLSSTLHLRKYPGSIIYIFADHVRLHAAGRPHERYHRPHLRAVAL